MKLYLNVEQAKLVMEALYKLKSDSEQKSEEHEGYEHTAQECQRLISTLQEGIEREQP